MFITLLLQICLLIGKTKPYTKLHITADSHPDWYTSKCRYFAVSFTHKLLITHNVLKLKPSIWICQRNSCFFKCNWLVSFICGSNVKLKTLEIPTVLRALDGSLYFIQNLQFCDILGAFARRSALSALLQKVRFIVGFLWHHSNALSVLFCTHWL